MPIIYEYWITIYGQIYEYSTASSVKSFSVKHNDNNFNFRFVVKRYTKYYDGPEPSTFDFTKAKLKGKLPDGTEIVINNLPVVRRTDGPYSNFYGGYETGLDVITVPFDERFSEQIGTSAYVLVLGTENEPDIASWQFKIQVVDNSSDSIKQIDIKLDADSHKKPVRVYLSQYDKNFKLVFHLYCSNGVWSRDRVKYSSSSSYTYAILSAYLRGVRPDGEIIDDVVTYDIYSGSMWNFESHMVIIDGTMNDIGEKITQVPGEYVTAITLYRTWPSPKMDMNTLQRVIFHIEPIASQETI